ncbi:hypothetical protein [Paenibacillus sp. P46E]|uniref:hypothetical protein n=1 Tax=Paenibacillus sp. P46E TaxID=1349436 RepID=UPI0009625901|nr:hypothetical protein [Paenibacillus sp. P46E]OKP95180.1 hypothetical protein A3849_26705 [Paenibacillus sp. P46E]
MLSRISHKKEEIILYKSLTLTTIYVGGPGGYPVDAISTNEPNKKQIARLIHDVADQFKIEGSLSKGEYKDLGHGNKAYEYLYGETKMLIIIKRLPIIEFEKDNDDHKLIELNPYL